MILELPTKKKMENDSTSSEEDVAITLVNRKIDIIVETLDAFKTKTRVE